ncbi:CHAT domain-containing protein [bacterium]|nr:CHAT domain-containing protein [candidate division CSSED10-310 bacterium]
MDEILRKFMAAPSLLIRYRQLRDHPNIISQQSLNLLDGWRKKALQQKNYDIVQNISSEILFLRCCLKNGVISALFGCDEEMPTETNMRIPLELGKKLYEIPKVQNPQGIKEAVTITKDIFHQVDCEKYPSIWMELLNKILGFYGQDAINFRSLNMEEGIALGENALQRPVGKIFPVLKAGTHFNLSVLYLFRLHGDRVQSLKKSIDYNTKALEVYTQENHPEKWAFAQMNRGTAFAKYIFEKTADNVEKSIRCYHNALKIFKKPYFPVYWARNQNNLGSVYSYRVRRNRADNLNRAVCCFRKACEIFDQEKFPEDWGRTQINLGIILCQPFRGDRAENFESAISHFRNALEIFTHQSSPVYWAIIQLNMGNAYRERLWGERADNLEDAIACYKNVLEVANKESHPELWIKAFMNLGTIFNLRIEGDRIKNLEKAIEYETTALEIATEDRFPDFWARINENLGDFYRDFHQVNPAENIEKAILFYNNALKFFNPNFSADDWGRTKLSLGLIYKKRESGKKQSNLKHAVSNLTEASTMYTQYSFPRQNMIINRELGIINLSQGNFQQAETAFDLALKSFELLYQQSLTHKTRENILEEGSSIFYLASLCHAKTGNHKKSVEILDRGKARFLSDRMALDRIKLLMAPVQVQNDYRRFVDRINELEGELKYPGPNSRGFLDITKDLKTIRSQLEKHIKKIKRYRSDFFQEGITFEKIRSLLPGKDAALLEFCVTEFGTLLITVFDSRDSEEGWIFINEKFRSEDLERLTSRWLNVCAKLRSESSGISEQVQWEESLQDILKEIYEQIFDAIDKKLIKKGIRRLLLSPHKGLHILPLHLMKRNQGNQKRYILEDYEITFIPNASILYHTLQNPEEKAAGITAIANPTADLPHTEIELQNIREFFDSDQSIFLIKDEVRYEKIIESSSDTGYLHFACHGVFDMNNPDASGFKLAMNKKDPSESKRLLTRDGRSITFCIESNKTPSEMLSLPDIFYKMKLKKTRLVVLSACETGLIAVKRKSDEYVGLPAGFLHAGAQAVVSSLWMVEDESTKDIIVRFYKNHIQNDMRPAKALKEAQISMMKKGYSPFHWGAFFVTGL